MNDSSIFGVSVRAWSLLIVLFTVCIMSIWQIKVGEPLYTLVGMIVGFYFGYGKGKQQQSET